MSNFLLQVLDRIRDFTLRITTMAAKEKTENVQPKTNFLVVTANVGTLFEDPEGIQSVWMKELFKVVEKHQAKFIAMHCQEIGGKDYKSSMEPVKQFFNKLMNHEALKDFSTVRGYLDGDFDHVDQYTALGNIYFVHKSLTSVDLFDYTNETFHEISGKELFSKNITALANVRKEKFQQDFFPDCKWSRKGYSRVRWKINGKVVEFVNIHLFHDDSNLVSIKSSPSPYTAYRKRALRFVLNRLREVNPVADGACFICGDFNFRLDVKSLVQKLCPKSRQQVVRAQDEDEIIRVVYRDEVNDEPNKDASNGDGADCESDEVLIKIERKKFEVEQSLLKPNSSYGHLRRFDVEPDEWNESLKEYDVTFAPTYPFSEDTAESKSYMDTRCPSWCDRILLTDNSWNWLHSQTDDADVTYDTIGNDACMGDHKPVYLAFTIAPDAKTSEVSPNSSEQQEESSSGT